MKLNPEQSEAAEIVDGSAVVIAGAGTGKTATLATRLARLVDAGVPAEQILLLTFTRRSALDMIDRACVALDQPEAGFSGGTFHSLSSAILRQFGSKIGLAESFTILDQDDVNKLISTLRADCPGSRGKRFPRSRTIATILSRAANTRRPVGAVVVEDYPHFTHTAADLDQLAVAYIRWKAARALVDFDDLLHLLIVLLRENKDVRDAVHARWRYIMVDEYQDTNVLQADIVGLLTGKTGNIMIVGDDAQSIYAFRGAKHANLHLFTKEFPNSTRVTLEQNYRSTQPILDLSNHLLNQMHKSFRKRLHTDRTDGSRPTLVRTADIIDEARYIAQQIETAHKQGTAYSDFAVLFRSGRQAYALEAELHRRKIPFIKYGGIRFTEAAHIKDITSILRMLSNTKDSLSLHRILSLAPGIGATTAGKIEWELDGRFSGDSLRKCNAPKKATDFIKELAGKVDYWQKTASAEPQEVIQDIIDFYQPILEEKFDDWPKRQKDLSALVSLSSGSASLTEFVAVLSLDPPNRFSDEGDLDPDGSRVVLSTIHSAKGLEWPRVFVIRAHEGSLPMTIDGSAESMDEELRLLYVAVTRAADELVITWPENQNGRNDGASRFLKNVPHEILAREILPGAGKVSPRGRHKGDWRQDLTW